MDRELIIVVELHCGDVHGLELCRASRQAASRPEEVSEVLPMAELSRSRAPLKAGGWYALSYAMLLQLGAVTAGILATVNAYNNSASIRPPLSYAPEPASVYVPPKSNTTVTLLDLIKSRPELSTLLKVIGEPAGKPTTRIPTAPKAKE